MAILIMLANLPKSLNNDRYFMKMLTLPALLAILIATNVQTQTIQTGSAKASGECSVAHSGNNDVITIENCGIGHEQADKIVEMLKAVLANQKEDGRDAKLDELLELARRAVNPYSTIETYQPNGERRKTNESTGASAVDSGASKEFQEMWDNSQKQNWTGQLKTAQAAIDKYPGWFSPLFFLGEAQFQLCMKKNAKQSLTKFVNDTSGADTFEKFRSVGLTLLDQLPTVGYKTYCTEQGKSLK